MAPNSRNLFKVLEAISQVKTVTNSPTKVTEYPQIVTMSLKILTNFLKVVTSFLKMFKTIVVGLLNNFRIYVSPPSRGVYNDAKFMWGFS